jgi:hypothetical protein
MRRLALIGIAVLLGLAACESPQADLERRAAFEGGRSGIELAVHQCVEREARATGRRYGQEITLNDAQAVGAVAVLGCSASMDRLRSFLLTRWSPGTANAYMDRLASRLQGDVVRFLPTWIKQEQGRS